MLNLLRKFRDRVETHRCRCCFRLCLFLETFTPCKQCGSPVCTDCFMEQNNVIERSFQTATRERRYIIKTLLDFLDGLESDSLRMLGRPAPLCNACLVLKEITDA